MGVWLRSGIERKGGEGCGGERRMMERSGVKEVGWTVGGGAMC